MQKSNVKLKLNELNKYVLKSNVHLLNWVEEKLFRKEFLGTTSNGRRCEILNEEDISFLISDHKDTVQVIALKPILCAVLR